MYGKVWDEITHPLSAFNGSTVENGCKDESMLAFKLIHFSEKGPRQVGGC